MDGPQAYTDQAYCASMRRSGDLTTGFRAIVLKKALRTAKQDGTTVDIQLSPFGLLIRREDTDPKLFELPKISNMLSSLIDNLIVKYPKVDEFRAPLERVCTIISTRSNKNTYARYSQSNRRVLMTLPSVDTICMHQIELLAEIPSIYGIKIFDSKVPYLEFFLGKPSISSVKTPYKWP